MAIDIEKIKPEIAKVAQKHNLALVILYFAGDRQKRDGAMWILRFWARSHFLPNK